jgi:hypothetical protein
VRRIAGDAFERAFARPATDVELDRAASFLGPSPGVADWADFAHALLVSAEFRYLR